MTIAPAALAADFAAACGVVPVPGPWGDALASLCAAAHAAWPGVQLGDRDFVLHLAAQVKALAGAPEVDDEGPAADALAAAQQLCSEDLYLAAACLKGDPIALGAFDAHCLPGLARSLRKLDPNPSFADEVKQSVRERLLVGDAGEPPRLASYSGRGALASWVRVAGLRLGINLKAKHQREQPVGDEPPPAAPTSDPELAYVKDLYRKEFKQAFHDAVASLTSDERALLRGQLCDGENIDALGERHGVHRATAARWLQQVRDRLQSETRRLLSQRLRLTPTDFDSVARLVLTRFDASVRRALERTEGPKRDR